MQRLGGCRGWVLDGWVGAGWVGGCQGRPSHLTAKAKGAVSCAEALDPPQWLCVGVLSLASPPLSLPTRCGLSPSGHWLRMGHCGAGGPKGCREAQAVQPVTEAPLGPAGEEGGRPHREKHGPTEANLGLTTCFSEPRSVERRTLHPQKRSPSSDVRPPPHPAGAVLLWSSGA